MNDKNEIDIDEVVSGFFFVEIKDQQRDGIVESVFKAVKTLFKRKVI